MLASCLAEAAGQPGLHHGQRWRYTPATLERWVAGVSWVHERAGHSPPGHSPVVRDLLAGLRRSRATPPRRKAPVLLADLEAMLGTFSVGAWPAAVTGVRHRCLLLFGWAGALRRGELAALNVGDVRWDRDDGLHLVVRSSKTDPEAEGAVVALPFGHKPATCGPCLWARWVELLASWDGVGDRLGGRAGLIRAVRAGRDSWALMSVGAAPFRCSPMPNVQRSRLSESMGPSGRVASVARRWPKWYGGLAPRSASTLGRWPATA